MIAGRVGEAARLQRGSDEKVLLDAPREKQVATSTLNVMPIGTQ